MAEQDSTAAEQWLPVVGYEGLYEVSDQGRVRSLQRDRIISGIPRRRKAFIMRQKIKKGHEYRSVGLYDRTGKIRFHLVSRLVLTCFVGAPPAADSHADHIDFDRANNRLSNLQWLKPADNHARSEPNRIYTRIRGEQSVYAKLTEKNVREIRARFAAGSDKLDLAREFNVCQPTIHKIVLRKRWRHVT